MLWRLDVGGALAATGRDVAAKAQCRPTPPTVWPSYSLGGT